MVRSVAPLKRLAVVPTKGESESPKWRRVERKAVTREGGARPGQGRVGGDQEPLCSVAGLQADDDVPAGRHCRARHDCEELGAASGGEQHPGGRDGREKVASIEVAGNWGVLAGPLDSTRRLPIALSVSTASTFCRSWSSWCARRRRSALVRREPGKSRRQGKRRPAASS